MSKRFDFSVLPDGFLIEAMFKGFNGCKSTLYWQICSKRDGEYYGQNYVHHRPLLNHWYFNDGSMVLPDGLVVDCLDREDDPCRALVSGILKNEGLGFYRPLQHETKTYLKCCDIIAVKIIGAHPDYADHAKELGIPVIDISEDG